MYLCSVVCLVWSVVCVLSRNDYIERLVRRFPVCFLRRWNDCGGIRAYWFVMFESACGFFVVRHGGDFDASSEPSRVLILVLTDACCLVHPAFSLRPFARFLCHLFEGLARGGGKHSFFCLADSSIMRRSLVGRISYCVVYFGFRCVFRK